MLPPSHGGYARSTQIDHTLQTESCVLIDSETPMTPTARDIAQVGMRTLVHHALTRPLFSSHPRPHARHSIPVADTRRLETLNQFVSGISTNILRGFIRFRVVDRLSRLKRHWTGTCSPRRIRCTTGVAELLPTKAPHVVTTFTSRYELSARWTLSPLSPLRKLEYRCIVRGWTFALLVGVVVSALGLMAPGAR